MSNRYLIQKHKSKHKYSLLNLIFTFSEACTSAHEDSVTCPLEVSELEPLEHELSDVDNKGPVKALRVPPNRIKLTEKFPFQLAESPSELPEPKLNNSHIENNQLSPYSEVVEPLKQEINQLRAQLLEAQAQLTQLTLNRIEECVEREAIINIKNVESPESHIEVDCESKVYSSEDKLDIKYSNIVPIHR